MTLGKRLLLYSANDPAAASLSKSTASWGCMVSNCSSLDELRARVEGGEFDMVLVEPSAVLQHLVAENTIDETLKLPLAEIEKRHIQRVLASTGGNKTQAARVLGIDTKTLYNKLKSYKSAEAVARKRSLGSNSMTII
jgi:DNA-binding protein Fis